MRGILLKRGETWSYVLYLGRGPDGKKQQKWVGGFRTRREAEANRVLREGRQHHDRMAGVLRPYADPWELENLLVDKDPSTDPDVAALSARLHKATTGAGTTGDNRALEPERGWSKATLTRAKGCCPFQSVYGGVMGRGGLYQIGEVAERLELSLRTVRYYEEVGLVTPAERSPGGFRLYDDDAIERLELIKQMKPLEFSLDETRELLELRRRLGEPGLAAGDRAQLVERLAMFTAAAEERCDRLAEHLARAEAFAETLRREIRRAKAAERRAAARGRS
jgi:MerR family copper efflux transcriptional regulator